MMNLPQWDDLAHRARPAALPVTGEEHMVDHSSADIDREFGSLVEGLDVEDRVQVGGSGRQLAMRVERLGSGVTPTVGARARFLMTT